jgi:hypothetical protein
VDLKDKLKDQLCHFIHAIKKLDEFDYHISSLNNCFYSVNHYLNKKSMGLEPECNTCAVFNVIGSNKGKFCAKHRQPKMIDIQIKLYKYTGDAIINLDIKVQTFVLKIPIIYPQFIILLYK